MLRISTHIFSDIVRNKIIVAYTIFLFVVTFGLFQIEDDTGKAVLSLLNIVLIVVPLISLIFSTIHYYNSLEFVQLMVSQPVSRTVIILSQYSGTTFSLICAFLIGAGVPICIYQFDATTLSLLFSGIVLSIIFSSIGHLVSVTSRDKARGIGVALMVWFYFSLIYDGLILLLLFCVQRLSRRKINFSAFITEPGGPRKNICDAKVGCKCTDGIYRRYL